MLTTAFDNVYAGYAYSYPHKHSYRRLSPLPIKALWQAEQKDALYLYMHLPFCEMRCGFCNLFTIAHPQQHMVDAYLKTLAREAAAIKELVAPQRFAQLAVGGGTPTFLNLHQLEKLFAIIRSLGCDVTAVPASFEMSPATITREKLAFLIDQGIDRASMGVQSFVEQETKALGRPQQNKQVYEALERLQQYSFATVNIDLIYGAYGQTLDSWLYSVQEVIKAGVQEVFIYPLYVRPLTGINKMNQAAEDKRFVFYREAKQLLLAAGYTQLSMRMFQKQTQQSKPQGRSYACQEDGMIGLGAGARSYTRAVHYSSEYAVARQNIRSIIETYINKEQFNEADYGIVLSEEEQQRRYVIKSVLHGSGLNIQRYSQLFNLSVLEQFPLLQELLQNGMATLQNNVLQLTSTGMDYADAIGPALYSEPIKELITAFELQ